MLKTAFSALAVTALLATGAAFAADPTPAAAPATAAVAPAAATTAAATPASDSKVVTPAKKEVVKHQTSKVKTEGPVPATSK